jgi:hypothetical protein
MCLIIIFISATIDYYLIWYDMTYLSEDIFFTILICTAFDIIAFTVAFSLFENIGFVKSVFISFLVALIGGTAFIMFLYGFSWN